MIKILILFKLLIIRYKKCKCLFLLSADTKETVVDNRREDGIIKKYEEKSEDQLKQELGSYLIEQQGDRVITDDNSKDNL